MGRAQLVAIEERHPKPRKIQQAVELLDRGGVIAYPTDTVYGIGCDLRNRKAVDRIYRMRRLERNHRLSLICPDLSTIATYAHVTDFAHRWMRRLLPGPYTVILYASRAVPKLLRDKRKEIGIRMPDSHLCQELSRGLGRPVMTTTAREPDEDDPIVDADVVRDVFGNELDLVLDGGLLTNELSTVLSLMDDEIEVMREGKGPVDDLLG